ncbi:MAG: hypothetical protein ACJ75H_05175 [Thermoanaerobaculia bacterium]
MIAFVTLLLGLISGNYPIEVTVSGPAAAVEFTVDGKPAGRIDAGPPWAASVELGADPLPHLLVARALDAGGDEIAAVSQWLNLPRPPAEVELVLEKGADGTPRAALLTWQSVTGAAPASIGLTLDGQPLTVEHGGRAPLPARNLEELHVLSAELWFAPGLLARKDVVYGGQYGSEVATELTAVPVRVRKGATLPEPEALAGWFAANGQPVSAAAVEDGPGKVVIVRVPGAKEVLDKLVPSRNRAGLMPTLRSEMKLGPEDGVRLLSLASSAYRDSRVPAQLFDMSGELTAKEGGVFWFLADKVLPGDSKREHRRVVDAVAVAGLQAAAENYRRAVVLVLGREGEDESRYEPAAVRRYLESIRVPLFVWSLYGPESRAAKAWGATEDVSSLYKLSKAVSRLRAELDAQRIVWLDGRHLPQTISLGAGADGVAEIAASAPVP